MFSGHYKFGKIRVLLSFDEFFKTSDKKKRIENEVSRIRSVTQLKWYEIQIGCQKENLL
jgi:hypothetical protein